MNQEFVKKMKQKLLSMKENLIQEIKINQSQTIDSQGDEVDMIQASTILGVSSDLLKRKTLQIKAIDSALEKIETLKDGESIYGICVDCQDDISEKRLEYNPWFDTCVDCASDRERERKQLKGAL